MPPGSFNHFPQIIETFGRAASAIVRKAAFDVQATAQGKAPVATGFLKSSIYTVTTESSSYGQGVVGGGAGSSLLPSVETPSDATTAFIAVGANYGVYLEFGTSRMAARPYMTPAADEVAPSFVAAWERLEEYLRTGGVR